MQIFESKLCSNPHSHGMVTCSYTTNLDPGGRDPGGLNAERGGD